jgi:hypothetical protein
MNLLVFLTQTMHKLKLANVFPRHFVHIYISKTALQKFDDENGDDDDDNINNKENNNSIMFIQLMSIPLLL